MEKKPLVSYGTYIMVWLALVVLTGVTVIATGLHFGQWSILAAILIATVKSVLVFSYFMNLKYEETIFKLMILMALFTLTVIMVLTFIDLSFR